MAAGLPRVGPAVAAVCAALWAADATGLLPARALAWDREALAAGQLWRAWTGHLVHWSALQALLDVGVFAALAAALERSWGPRGLSVATLVWMPLLSAVLWLAAPGLTEYRGASGLAVAAAWALGWQAWIVRPSWRPALTVLIGVGLGKLVADAWGVAGDVTGLPADVRVAWQAHAAGALAGSATAWLRAAAAREPDRPAR